MDIERLKTQIQRNSELIRSLDTGQQSFYLQYYKFQQINDHLQQSQGHMFMVNGLIEQKKSLEIELQEIVKKLSILLRRIVKELQERYIDLSVLLSHIVNDELENWKRNQQLAGNGFNFDSSHLDVLQACCEGLAEIIWTNLTQVKETARLAELVTQCIGESHDVINNLCELKRNVTELLTTIVTNTFVVEKQPPQVMKTNTRFSAKVRLLVGRQLNVHMNPPQVNVSIISEQQANFLVTAKNNYKGEVSGDILNNTGTMEYDQTSKQLSITFRNMQLKKILRAEKRGSESVVDEKFSLLFSSNFFLVGGEIDFRMWTLSLPVTVIVHGNQEPHAWATITWDNAFAEPLRNPFVVPDKVHWGKIAYALNLKFGTVTGRTLSTSNFNYLAEKLFRMQSDYDTLHLSWSQFSKDSLIDRNFAFWDWFYSIMKLTKEHLKPLWVDGSIFGFVCKKQAEDMLSSCPTGTFLLRFSESELGGITVAWVGDSGGQKEVIMLQPFTAKDFAIRTLADRLNDLSHLLYLYPDTPKEKAVGRYYSPFINSQCTSVNGYLKPLLVTHVPGLGSPNPSNKASYDRDNFGGENNVDYYMDSSADFPNSELNFNGFTDNDIY